LNDFVEVQTTPPTNYESSWVPPNRVDDFMKEEVAFTSLQQRNEAVPTVRVTAQLPPTLVRPPLIARPFGGIRGGAPSR